MAEFVYQNPFPVKEDTTKYRLITKDFVSTEEFNGRKILKVKPEGLELLAREAFFDVSFFLRSSHMRQLAAILEDPEASDNERFVAYTMIKNQVVSAEGKLPTCQDTGTAIIMAKKGEDVYTGVDDAMHLSKGIFDVWQQNYLRYSILAPLTMTEEKNTTTNLPAQIDIYSSSGNSYEFLIVTKGGGSANKSLLFQQTKSLLNEENLTKFFKEKISELGSAACPPYHLAIVIGGSSAEANLAVVKKASTGYYDNLPTQGNIYGQAFRDLEWEERIKKITQESGIGAQFGGKYFAHDVRVIRLPRHAASCPVGIGVSCSADRNIKAKITEEGIFIEELEKNPERYMPAAPPELSPAVEINLDRPMNEVLEELSKYPVKTRLSLSGTLIVARDVAHARINKILEEGKPMPEYFKNHPIYYAGPAKTPKGMACGSMGPTTANRMDPYVDLFQSHSGSLIMLAKGNRTQVVTDACKKYGGFFLGSIGGPAAVLAQNNIKSIECLEYPELGMEAIWKIEVKDFPAFILVDDKGNDFFKQIKPRCTCGEK